MTTIPSVIGNAAVIADLVLPGGIRGVIGGRCPVGADEGVPRRDDSVGRRGVALTDVIPSGRSGIDGEKREVMAEGAAIVKGTTITVVSVRGPGVLVRETTAGE